MPIRKILPCKQFVSMSYHFIPHIYCLEKNVNIHKTKIFVLHQYIIDIYAPFMPIRKIRCALTTSTNCLAEWRSP